VRVRQNDKQHHLTTPHALQSKVTTQRTIGPDSVSFASLAPGETVKQVTFVANNGHWAGAPIAQRIILPANLNSSAISQALKSGTIDIAYGAATLSPSDFTMLRTSGDLRALISPPLQTRLLLLNSAPGRVTSSRDVRVAINAAVDRTALSGLLSGLEPPATRAFSTDNAYCNVDVGALPSSTADGAAAATALSNAGWNYASAGDAFRSQSGVTLSLEVLFVGTDASASAIVPAIATQLRAVGFNASVAGVSKTAFNARGFAGTFDTLITETLGDPYDPASYAASWRVARSFEYPAQQGLDGSGPTGVNKAALDADITAVFTMLDETVRATTWRRILTVVNKEALFAPLTYMTTRAVMRAAVTGFAFGPQQFDLPLTRVSLGGGGGGGGGSEGLSVGAIAGIAVGAVVGVGLLAGGAIKFMRSR
jgi:nickel transport system substrate-binding protein